MTWKSNWFYRHKDEVVRYGVLLLVFIIGLVLSPFIRNCIRSLQEEDTEELVYATDMVIGDGKYSGTILKNTNIRSGYGRYETTQVALSMKATGKRTTSCLAPAQLLSPSIQVISIPTSTTMVLALLSTPINTSGGKKTRDWKMMRLPQPISAIGAKTSNKALAVL